METLLPLIAANNRLTEAFKMWLRDHTKVADEPRRILTLLFSYFFGVVLVFAMALSGIKFDIPALAPFAGNDIAFAFVVGAMVSFGGALAQPLLELVGALASRTQPTPTPVAEAKKN